MPVLPIFFIDILKKVIDLTQLPSALDTLNKLFNSKKLFFLSPYSLIMIPVEEVNTQIGALDKNAKIKFFIDILEKKTVVALSRIIKFYCIWEAKQPQHCRCNTV